MFFWFSLDYLFSSAFVVMGLVSSVKLCQEIGWEERLRNDLFCVEWDDQSINATFDIFADFYITDCRRLIFYLGAPRRNNPLKCM